MYENKRPRYEANYDIDDRDRFVKFCANISL